MKTNMMSVAEAEAVFGGPVPEHLLGSHWENGRFVCRVVIREQLDEWMAKVASKKAAREASRAEREADNAAWLARSRQVGCDENERI